MKRTLAIVAAATTLLIAANLGSLIPLLDRTRRGSTAPVDPPPGPRSLQDCLEACAGTLPGAVEPPLPVNRVNVRCDRAVPTRWQVTPP